MFIYYCMLTSVELWMAPKLTLVDFHDNLIEEVQPEIIYCQSLEMLFLMKNKLHCIPIQITRLPLLNHLIVGSNLLGKFVLGVKSMTSLFQLSLVNNQRLAHIPVDLYMARHHIHNLHLTGFVNVLVKCIAMCPLFLFFCVVVEQNLEQKLLIHIFFVKLAMFPCCRSYRLESYVSH